MGKFPKSEVSVLVLGKDNSGGGGKRLHAEIRRGLQFLGVAEVDEYGPHAGAFAAIDVAPAIADHPGAGEVEAEVARRVEQHAGLGLAATVVGMRDALARGIASLDACDLGDEFPQSGVHGLDDGLRLGAAADVGLVGRDHQHVACRVQGTAGGGHVFEQAKILQAVGRIGLALPHDLSVQRAIAVEENRGPAHGLAATTDSHFVWLILTSGCETQRCQTTAWKASEWGVTLLALTVGTITQASATLAV